MSFLLEDICSRISLLHGTGRVLTGNDSVSLTSHTKRLWIIWRKRAEWNPGRTIVTQNKTMKKCTSKSTLINRVQRYNIQFPNLTLHCILKHEHFTCFSPPSPPTLTVVGNYGPKFQTSACFEMAQFTNILGENSDVGSNCTINSIIGSQIKSSFSLHIGIRTLFRSSIDTRC